MDLPVRRLGSGSRKYLEYSRTDRLGNLSDLWTQIQFKKAQFSTAPRISHHKIHFAGLGNDFIGRNRENAPAPARPVTVRVKNRLRNRIHAYIILLTVKRDAGIVRDVRYLQTTTHYVCIHLLISPRLPDTLISVARRLSVEHTIDVRLSI